MLLQRSAAVAEHSIDRVRDAIVVVAAVSGWVWHNVDMVRDVVAVVADGGGWYKGVNVRVWGYEDTRIRGYA